MPDTSVSPEPIILVAIGGAPEGAVRLPQLPAGSVVVGVDGGLARLRAAEMPVHHVVGDLDSVDPATVVAAGAAGATVHRHEADKDATDLELALDLVLDEVARPGLERLVVVGPGGGRLDHLLADALQLSAPRLAHLEVIAHLDGATLQVLRPGAPTALVAPTGAQVSLLPFHGPADGVTTDGLRWALTDAHLAVGTTRAMSNEVVGEPATVELASGVLVAVAPGIPAPQIAPRPTPYDPTPRPTPDAAPEEEQS